MEYPYIKNITHEKVQTLAGLVNAEDGQIVSKTLAQNEAVSVTLFAFAKGEEISTHDSTGDAMVTVLERHRPLHGRWRRAPGSRRRSSRHAGEKAARRLCTGSI